MRRGMTLIEVVVSLGILALMGAITWTSLAGTLKARDILEANDEVQQSARVAMAKISRDIELAFLHRDDSTVNTYRTLFVGEDGDSRDTLWFTTLNHQRLYRDARECDQTEVTYWTEPDPEPDHDGLFVLLQREAPRIDQEPDKDGRIYPLAYGVQEFAVRYLDGKTCEWKDEWNTASVDHKDQLPRAVQVMLKIMGPDPDDDEKRVPHTFATTILTEYGGKARCVVVGGEQQEDGG